MTDEHNSEFVVMWKRRIHVGKGLGTIDCCADEAEISSEGYFQTIEHTKNKYKVPFMS